MIKVKSREEILVITRQIEACESLEALHEVFKEHGAAQPTLRAVFMKRIKQIHRQ